MNERIRQLMIKAICEVDDCGDPKDKELQKDLKRMYIPNVFAERFTELVLQDCFDILSGYTGCENLETNHNHPIFEIKKHFGV